MSQLIIKKSLLHNLCIINENENCLQITYEICIGNIFKYEFSDLAIYEHPVRVVIIIWIITYANKWN